MLIFMAFCLWQDERNLLSKKRILAKLCPANLSTAVFLLPVFLLQWRLYTSAKTDRHLQWMVAVVEIQTVSRVFYSSISGRSTKTIQL